MAAVAYQTVGYVGTDPTFQAAASGGDNVRADPNGLLWVKNAAAGGDVTVTITVPGSTQGQDHPDVAVVIADGAERMIGPLVDGLVSPDTFGVVLVGYSNVTGVTVAAIKVR